MKDPEGWNSGTKGERLEVLTRAMRDVAVVCAIPGTNAGTVADNLKPEVDFCKRNAGKISIMMIK